MTREREKLKIHKNTAIAGLFIATANYTPLTAIDNVSINNNLYRFSPRHMIDLFRARSSKFNSF